MLTDFLIGFGEKHLEKDPLKEVAPEPLHLLDRLRHQRTTKTLDQEKEAKIEELIQKFVVDCRIRGIQAIFASSSQTLPSSSAPANQNSLKRSVCKKRCAWKRIRAKQETDTSTTSTLMKLAASL